jgi:hypothetical protein
MKSPKLEILLTADQLDGLLCIPIGTCQGYVDRGICPDYIWHEGMSRPRWGKRGFIEWLKILHEVDLTGSGQPPLANPHEVFKDHRGGAIDTAA